jgi:ketosteroid isomerase-like protein
MSGSALADSRTDRKLIGELDRKFQAAVKQNDAVTMAEILHPDMILVLGDGRTFTREEQLRESEQKLLVYEIQDEEPGTQTIRVYGDTGVVTALLRIKGTNKGVGFDRRVWFSDTYVRTPSGWKYFIGQASLALPSAARSATGHSYTDGDIKRTGASSVGDALRLLDPSITIHR